MAPVLAVVLNAPAAVPAAGAALPLSFLLAFVAAALVGNTVVQFSRVLPSAGSFYTFNSRGLGPGATGAYGFTGAIGTVAIVIVYMLSNIAHIRYFWRAPGRSPFARAVIPALSAICLSYLLASGIAPGQLFPYSLVPLVVIAWLIVGVVPDGDVSRDGPRKSKPDLVAAGERYPAAIEAAAKDL
jgi:amino acid transporter